MGPPEHNTGTCSCLNEASGDPSFRQNRPRLAVGYPVRFVGYESERRQMTTGGRVCTVCGLVTAEMGCLSQHFVDPESFILPQQRQTQGWVALNSSAALRASGGGGGFFSACGNLLFRKCTFSEEELGIRGSHPCPTEHFSLHGDSPRALWQELARHHAWLG